VNAGPTAGFSRDAVVEVGEAVEVVEVPGEGFVLSVNLESFVGLMAAGVSGGLEDGEGTVFEASEEGAGVVDGDGVLFAGFLVDAFFDEGLGHGGDAGDVSVDPAGAVDVVSEEVAGYTGSCGGGVETPEGGSALWKFFGHGPVLKEVGAVVVDTAEFSGVDDFLGKGDGGEEAVVIPDEVGEAGGFHGFYHFEALFAVEGEGLFAEDHFAIFDGGHGDVVMRVVGGADVDGVDVVTFDEFTPVGLGVGVAPLFGEGFYFFFAASADDLADGDVLGVEEVVDLGVGVGVGAAHEAVAYDADANWFFRHDTVVVLDSKLVRRLRR